MPQNILLYLFWFFFCLEFIGFACCNRVRCKGWRRLIHQVTQAVLRLRTGALETSRGFVSVAHRLGSLESLSPVFVGTDLPGQTADYKVRAGDWLAWCPLTVPYRGLYGCHTDSDRHGGRWVEPLCFGFSLWSYMFVRCIGAWLERAVD